LSGVEECYRGRHVRVFRLDQAGVLTRLRQAARRLVQHRPEVVEVWLFGSLGRQQAMPGSDADLLIVVRDGAGPFLERPQALAPYFEGIGVGRDLLVYTESELEHLARIPRSLARTARDDGMLLARR
jgi:uncharacterized protein